MIKNLPNLTFFYEYKKYNTRIVYFRYVTFYFGGGEGYIYNVWFGIKLGYLYRRILKCFYNFRKVGLHLSPAVSINNCHHL